MRLIQGMGHLGTLSQLSDQPAAAATAAARLLDNPSTCQLTGPPLRAALAALAWPAPPQPAIGGAQQGVTISLLEGDLPGVKQLTRAQLQHSVDSQRATSTRFFWVKLLPAQHGSPTHHRRTQRSDSRSSLSAQPAAVS